MSDLTRAIALGNEARLAAHRGLRALEAAAKQIERMKDAGDWLSQNVADTPDGKAAVVEWNDAREMEAPHAE